MRTSIETKDTELAFFIVGMDKLPFLKSRSKLKNIHQNFDDLSRDYKTIISLVTVR
jgi:hypothetical protein